MRQYLWNQFIEQLRERPYCELRLHQKPELGVAFDESRIPQEEFCVYVFRALLGNKLRLPEAPKNHRGDPATSKELLELAAKFTSIRGQEVGYFVNRMLRTIDLKIG